MAVGSTVRTGAPFTHRRWAHGGPDPEGDEPAAVDKLLDIARTDPDKDLRKKALFWLGQSSDPRAAKALQDIIEQP